MLTLPTLPAIRRSAEGCEHRLDVPVPYGEQIIHIHVSSCQEGRVRGEINAKVRECLGRKMSAAAAQAALQSFADGSSVCDRIYSRPGDLIPLAEAMKAEEQHFGLRTQGGDGYFIAARARRGPLSNPNGEFHDTFLDAFDHERASGETFELLMALLELQLLELEARHRALGA